MAEESRPNPYEASSRSGDLPTRRGSDPSARWVAVPFFTFGGAVIAAVATFVSVELFMSAGDFTEMIAAGFAFIALVVGGAAGLIAGIGFARGTHLR